MKTEVIDWKSFMSGEYKRQTKTEVVVKHFERHKVIYQVSGATVILFLLSDVSAFADVGGLDVKATDFYNSKILTIGKWAIIIKGGWTTIQKTLQEDFEGAKKTLISYVLAFVLLVFFPKIMEEIKGLVT